MSSAARGSSRRRGSWRSLNAQATRTREATARTEQAKAWREVLDDRRASVYRTDVEFTGTDRAPNTRYTPAEKAALVERLKVLRAEGLTFLECSNLLGPTTTTLSNWLRGEKGGGTA